MANMNSNEEREKPKKITVPPKASLKQQQGMKHPGKDLSDIIPGIRKPDSRPEDENPKDENPEEAPKAEPEQRSGEGDAAAHTAMLVVTPDEVSEASEGKGSAPGHKPAEQAGPEKPSDDTKDQVGSDGKSHDEADGGETDSEGLNVLGSSSQTIHIQLPEDELPQETTSPNQSRGGAPTVRLKRPPSVKVKNFASGLVEARKKEEGSSTAGEEKSPEKGKSSTSRIPLSSVTPAIATGKTVRAVRPAGGSGSPKPGAKPLPSLEKPPSAAQVQAAKSKTSRISLEEALGVGGEESQSPDGPKTIRLKKPSSDEAPTVQAPKVSPTSSMKSTTNIGASSGEAKDGKRTAKLPDDIEPGGDEAEGGVTRRKTIRVRRPDESMVAGLSGEGEAETLPTMMPESAGGPDRVHPVFIVCALAATLVSALLIWVLAAQAFGPDRSLTRFSSWTNGPRLWMPGDRTATR